MRMLRNEFLQLGRTYNVTEKLIRSLLQTVGTPLSSRVLDLFDTGKHQEIVDLEINPQDYTDPDDFADDYLVVSLLSKYQELKIPIDREKVALEKFWLAEERCSRTNVFLRSCYAGSSNHSKTLSSILYMAQIKIGRLLGGFSWDEASGHFGFGPGSSLTLTRRYGDSYYKFGNLKPTTTAGNADLARAAICSSTIWHRHICLGTGPRDVTIVPGNRITTVPKNAKTDRVIATEPDLNMYIQKGIGAMIRRRLKRVGVNLDDQSLNQRLAREGSIDDCLATIDLSAASDSVSLELCEQLLPPEWMEALLASRSPEGVLPDRTVITYEKVSSMGNGFTFELESLIFWAIAESVIDFRKDKERRLAVYGDDIIVSRESAPLLVSVLGLVGFETNLAKTFISGRFRESCGKHYFSGVDVTPFYLREKVDNPERIIWFANTIRRYASRWSERGYCDSRFKPCYDQAVSFLPRFLRRPSVPLVSDGTWFSDTALGGDFDEVLPRFNRRLFLYEAVHYVRRFTSIRGEGDPMLMRSLTTLHGGFLPPPGSLRSTARFARSALERIPERPIGDGSDQLGISTQRWRYRKVKSCVAQWGCIGPWL